MAVKPEEDFLRLNKDWQRLRDKLVVLEAREKTKKEEKANLLKELAAEGINIQDLDGEIARLEGEIEEDYQTLSERIILFEEELTKAEKGNGQEIEQPADIPVPVDPETGEDLEI